MKLHTEKCIASNAATHLSRHIGAKTEDAFLPNEKCTYNGYNIQMCRNCIIAYRFSFFNTFPKNVIPDPSSPFDPFPFQNHSPPKKVSGIEMTNAHGQDTTRKTNPLRIHSVQPPPRRIGGRIARIAAKITTTGV